MSSPDQRHLGTELFHNGEYEQASTVFAQALRKKEDSDLWNDWAVARAAAGAFEDAITGLQRALALNPQHSDAVSNLSIVRELIARGSDTRSAHSSKANAADRLHAEALESFRAGNIGDAVSLIRDSLDREESSIGWNDCGTILLTLNDLSGAEKAYRRALALEPANRMAASNLIILLESLGRHGEAAQWIQIAPSELVSRQRDAALLAAIESGDSRAFEVQLQNWTRQIPDQDPGLPPPIAAAFSASRHSGFFVKQAFERISKVLSSRVQPVLEALQRLPGKERRLDSLEALCQMQEGRYRDALALWRRNFDAQPSDLFLESQLMACEHRIHGDNPSASNSFAGLEAYLAESFCDRPWKHMEIGVDGGIYLCCPGWLPFPVAEARGQSWQSAWNSEMAAEIRRSVLTGSFEYCSKIHCPRIAARDLPRKSARPTGEIGCGRSLPGPAKLVLSYDRTCNLACAQCRATFVTADRERQKQMDADYTEQVLATAKRVQTLYLNGSGELFASRHSRRILALLNRREYPNLKFSIISNGQLFDRRAFDTFDLKKRIEHIDISIDAATAATYKLARRGGNFSRLLKNLSFLDRLRATGDETFTLSFNFVVTALNFREMPAFVRLGRRFHCDSILFTIIRNWGHLNAAEFARLNIGSPAHAEHRDFIAILDAIELQDSIVDWGSIRPFKQAR